MVTVITEEYEISINLSYILREIDMREDEDASSWKWSELYKRVINNLYRDEMIEEWVLTYKHRILWTHPEEQFFEKPLDIIVTF